jgi:transcriptional regulator with XRE-family HTH domain
MVGFDPASASSRMNHYEKGRHVPDIDTLRRIAAELNVPLNYFFCDDQTTAELALIISRMTDEERNNLVEALKLSSGINHADKK